MLFPPRGPEASTGARRGLLVNSKTAKHFCPFPVAGSRSHLTHVAPELPLCLTGRLSHHISPQAPVPRWRAQLGVSQTPGSGHLRIGFRPKERTAETSHISVSSIYIRKVQQQRLGLWQRTKASTPIEKLRN